MHTAAHPPPVMETRATLELLQLHKGLVAQVQTALHTPRKRADLAATIDAVEAAIRSHGVHVPPQGSYSAVAARSASSRQSSFPRSYNFSQVEERHPHSPNVVWNTSHAPYTHFGRVACVFIQLAFAARCLAVGAEQFASETANPRSVADEMGRGIDWCNAFQASVRKPHPMTGKNETARCPRDQTVACPHCPQLCKNWLVTVEEARR